MVEKPLAYVSETTLLVRSAHFARLDGKHLGERNAHMAR